MGAARLQPSPLRSGGYRGARREKEHSHEEKSTRSVDQSETIKPAKKAKVEKKPKPEKDEGGGGEDGGDDDGDVGLL